MLKPKILYMSSCWYRTNNYHYLPDINECVISIVENGSDYLQICDDEQVNLDISIYRFGAENSDNGTEITVWLVLSMVYK